MDTESLFEAAYDHYKDSFERIRVHEVARDRRFLVLVGLIGLLLLFTEYPQEVVQTAISALGKSGTVAPFPNHVILSVIWTALFIVHLRYLQSVTTIERRYTDLHRIEERLSTLSGDENLFRREGRSYSDNYPLFQSWVWMIHAWVIPFSYIGVTSTMIFREYYSTVVPLPYFVYDLTAFAATTISGALRLYYQIQESANEQKSTS